jgi:hypothetical protein
MHIGGQIILKLLASDGDKLTKLFGEHVLEPYLRIRSENKSRIESYLSNNFDPFYQQHGFSSTDMLKLVLFQSIRICCLVHDIGHPPFSHAVEDVLISHLRTKVNSRSYEDFYNAFWELTKKDVRWGLNASGQPSDSTGTAGGDLHELVGRMIAEGISNRLVKQDNLFGAACLWLSLEISRAKDSPTGAVGMRESLLSCFHDLISGPVDADRLDYIERDSVSSGLEFGRFDRNRIISTLRLDFSDTSIKARPTTVALSAVESFFLERYRNQRWLVFHHNVARGDVAVARAMDVFLRVWFEVAILPSAAHTRLREVLMNRRISLLWEIFRDGYDFSANAALKFSMCDEPWMYGVFREIDGEMADFFDPECLDLAVLKACLGMICRREKSGLVSLWKRIEEYAIFSERFRKSFRGKGCDAFLQKNSIKRDEPPAVFANKILSIILRPRVKTYGSLPVLQSIEKRLFQATDSVLLLRFSRFVAKTPFELIDPQRQRLVDISQLSTLVAQLDQIWLNDIRLHAFLVPREGHRIAKSDLAETIGDGLPSALMEVIREFKI